MLKQASPSRFYYIQPQMYTPSSSSLVEKRLSHKQKYEARFYRKGKPMNGTGILGATILFLHESPLIEAVFDSALHVES